jgi:hypothetical protein
MPGANMADSFTSQTMDPSSGAAASGNAATPGLGLNADQGAQNLDANLGQMNSNLGGTKDIGSSGSMGGTQ